MFLKLASKSLKDRQFSAILTILAMTISLLVLISVEHIRHQAKASFNHSISGIDLVVGAKTGDLNLLLYSVFRIGTATNNISWESYQQFANHRQVSVAIPMSLGDSHRGYRVLGTDQQYFQHFSYGNQYSLDFAAGKPFDQLFDVVLGYEVAAKLNYELGDQIILSHGIGKTSLSQHDDRPFRVVGILEATGTPVDQTLHVSLEAIEAIHINWHHGMKLVNASHDETLDMRQLQPKQITAFMLKLKSRVMTFHVQREINDYRQEPLLAILPGVTLSQLWRMTGVFENLLRLIAGLVFISSLLGLAALLIHSIKSRQQEIELLKMVGASPNFLFIMIISEALLIFFISFIKAIILFSLAILVGQDYFAKTFGLIISHDFFSTYSLYMLAILVTTTVVISAIPAFSLFSITRNSHKRRLA